MSTIHAVSRALSAMLAPALAATVLTAHAPAAAAALPCMVQDDGLLGFRTLPSLRPNQTSRVLLTLPGNALSGTDFPLNVSRADGSHPHPVTFTRFQDVIEILGGRDPDLYGLADAGEWILHKPDGTPWQRYMIQLEGWWQSGSWGRQYVTAGRTANIRGVLAGWQPNGTTAPVPGLPVTFQVRALGRLERTVVKTSSSTGSVNLSFVAVSNRDIKAVVHLIPQGTTDSACLTHRVDLPLNSEIRVRKVITRTVSDLTPAVGQTARISGTIYPARADSQPVHLQRWNGSKFVTIGVSSTTRAAGGKYAFSYKPTTRGSHVIRVFTPWDNWHVGSASPNAYLTAH